MPSVETNSLWENVRKPRHERRPFCIEEESRQYGADAVAAVVDVDESVELANDPVYEAFLEEAQEYRDRLRAEGRSS